MGLGSIFGDSAQFSTGEGGAWATRPGRPRERRQLKHRAAKEVRHPSQVSQASPGLLRKSPR